jgi:SHAQKYF class myb-like DNA-binding protein
MADKSDKCGRWTDEEHELFLEGLIKFGRDWVAVAEAVQTRSTTQVCVPFKATVPY